MAGRKRKTFSVRVEQRKLPSGLTTFNLITKVNGEKSQESLNLKSRNTKEIKQFRKIAEEAKQKKEELLRKNLYGTKPKLDSISVHALFESYLREYKKADLNKVKALTEKVKSYFNQYLLAEHLSPPHCEKFKDALLEELKKETARNYLQVFKKVLKDGVKNGFIHHNPAQDIVIKAKSDRMVKNVLEPAELRTLEEADCGNPDVKKAFLFACLTGLGHKECSQLTWANIIETNGNQYVSYFRAKTDNATQVKLSKALEFIGERRQMTDLIFPKLPSNEGTNKSLRRWVQNAGIQKHITFYCARHSFGLLQALNGTNILTISKNMGHSSTTHTLKYLNFMRQPQDEAVDKISF